MKVFLLLFIFLSCAATPLKTLPAPQTDKKLLQRQIWVDGCAYTFIKIMESTGASKDKINMIKIVELCHEFSNEYFKGV